MADVRRPPTLPHLFPGLTRRLGLDAARVGELLEHLDARWPGLRDRLCEAGPVIRRHIHHFLAGERAELHTAVPARSRMDVITAISGG